MTVQENVDYLVKQYEDKIDSCNRSLEGNKALIKIARSKMDKKKVRYYLKENNLINARKGAYMQAQFDIGSVTDVL